MIKHKRWIPSIMKMVVTGRKKSCVSSYGAGQVVCREKQVCSESITPNEFLPSSHIDPLPTNCYPSAEVNLIKAEALLTEIFPNINNLNRLQQRDDQDSSKDDQDKQSIFSRLSRSSKMSRKVSTSCSRQRLRMLIAADTISISSFLGQARGAVKHQKGYISRASRSAFTPQEAEKWLSDAIATGPDPYALQYIGARQVRYLSEPKKKGYTLLCQTKAYKNTMRAQEARLLRIEKTMQTLK